MKDYLKDLQKDVDKMNESFDGGDVSTDPPSTEAPGTKVPGTTAPETKAPATEAPGTEAPGTEAPSTDAPTTKASATEAPGTAAPEDKDETIRKLREKLEEKEGTPKTDAPKTEAPGTEAPLVLEEQDFLKDLDLDEVSRDPVEFNKLLNKLYQKAVTDTRKVLGESVLRSIPDIVRANVNVINTLQEASDKFYAGNKDLKPFKKVVAAVFEDVLSENPDKDYGELFEKVGAETRKRLELVKEATKSDDKDPPPSLPRKKGKSGKSLEKPNVTPLESELDEMNKVVRR